MFDPPPTEIASLTLTVIVTTDVAPAESVTVIVSIKVPGVTFAPTLTTPVVVSIEILATVNPSANVFVPVPPATDVAEDESARPKVVVTFDGAVATNMPFTVNVKA